MDSTRTSASAMQEATDDVVITATAQRAIVNPPGSTCLLEVIVPTESPPVSTKPVSKQVVKKRKQTHEFFKKTTSDDEWSTAYLAPEDETSQVATEAATGEASGASSTGVSETPAAGID